MNSNEFLKGQLEAERADADRMYRAYNRNSKLWLALGVAALAFQAFLTVQVRKVAQDTEPDE